jgi:tRNA pseudouridine32 synthase / 23S rRNA pseudouridine746 synthase
MRTLRCANFSLRAKVDVWPGFAPRVPCTIMLNDEPVTAGVRPSRLQLPEGSWATLLDGLCARFPSVARDCWLDRFARGRVHNADGMPIDATTPYQVGTLIHYFREVMDEPRIAAQASVLYADAHLVVVDKPHFLPVMPSGAFVEETLLTRLVRRFGNTNLVPLHRIDRETAGLVMFSANPGTRSKYHALFRDRAIDKTYQALAPPSTELAFPIWRRSRLEAGVPFFRMCEVEGAANAETLIEVLERGVALWRYALTPITGKKHQLRVHMAALGAPIHNDRCYPFLREYASDDSERPLQLLAKSLTFVDPVNGEPRQFQSRVALGATTSN